MDPLPAPGALTNAWIFQANPDQYDLQAALSELDEMAWTMNQHRERVQVGDSVDLWETGADAGIVAVCTVLTGPEILPEREVERRFWRDPEGVDAARPRVRIKIDRMVEPRVPREALRAHPILSELPNLRMAQGTNYLLPPDMATALHAFTADWPAQSPATKPRSDVGSAWIVLQKGDASYRDIEGRAYHYPTSIPNGRRIAAGDLVVVARPLKMAEPDGGRIVGVGHIGRLEPEDGAATAWYDWYTALTPPVSFEEAGGDPRVNVQHSMNPVTREWAERVLAARGLTVEGMPPIDHTDPLPQAPARPPDSAARRDPRLTMAWLEAETLWPRDELEAIIETLTGSSPQVILAGPPGTGKTWVAQHIARYLTGGVAGSVRLVQFHPSYAYEQFIEGLRPVVEKGGGIAFRRVDGVVLDIVSGMDRPDDRRVLVIDEMNRANLPRVFGELMFLFEYRQEPIALRWRPEIAGKVKTA